MVDLQSTNRVKISTVRETTFNTTPTSPGFKTRRVTSHGLAAAPQTVVSQEIRSDRQVTDLILVGRQAGGSVGGEISFKVMDEDWEEALQSTWSTALPVITVATLDTEISDVSLTTLTVSAGGAAFKAGMLAYMSGFTTAANNKIARVASSSATTIVFPAATFAVEAAAIPVGAQARVVGFQGASGDLVATITNGNALTSTALDFTTLGLVVGQWVRIGGTAAGDQLATAVDNDFCRISAITATRLSFDRVPASWAADAGTSKTLIVFAGDVLTNGSTKRSRTIERQYLDQSPAAYEYFAGQALDSLSLNIAAGAVATYTESWIGAGYSVSASRASGATDTAAPTNDVLNAASNVGRIAIDGTVLTGPNFVKTATVQIANNLRRQDAIGSLDAVGIGNGQFAVTGTLSTYFGDKTLLDKVLNNTLTSFDFRLGRTDTNNETLLFDFPSVKFSSGAPTVSGPNADVMLDLGYQAIMDATLQYTMLIERFWYLP